ncbi:nitrate reductase molybdenum cofactor assembly chaperone [Ottowia sp.]|uniref:nitrate reductase molybdenum cofactor assembly chaperone n=1 Tax=Ottowia sp. TaxID=1898956 RepID=UPI001D1F6212|nr:nitrate reductase molybdenum cofactor assembly chaperone [Ottowia sp.]MCB2026304.1 nitrate reductase molybdenum cofactor assembly chaperone [Ottowia sp.]MCP5259356.1 nitrate reductase molybdenum cofactor assembly chaperone [Burkholderiaceae bacterium]HPR45644.1 nitrate reductase molybdenum cofactor assembly chaperone [Ottowia sp.]HRW72358.1 nitrate reductase molybdenum cofactor assembly chaperone [Ottowia sp.]
MKDMKYSLRALARLLSYPDAEWREQAVALVDAIESEKTLPSARVAELRTLVSAMLCGDPMEIESRYVETFDRGRATSLHLFEHVHGDSRDRGPAMIDLVQTYEKAGLYLSADELPDHLGAVLEFASTQPAALAKAFLGEVAHILNAIFSALLKRESPYASVVAAVLELAGQKAQAVPFTADEPMDEAWAEPEAFNGCSSRGQSRPGQAQPIHIVRRDAAEQQRAA